MQEGVGEEVHDGGAQENQDGALKEKSERETDDSVGDGEHNVMIRVWAQSGHK